MLGFGRTSSVILVPESTGNGGITMKLDVPAAPRDDKKVTNLKLRLSN